MNVASCNHWNATAEFSPAIIAPTYNNAGTLCAVLDRIERLGHPLIVVDDGSTDETAERLSAWKNQSHGISVTVVAHPKNRGKASALRSGFAAAAAAGHTHVATMDTDAQLDPEDIPATLRAAREIPGAIVVGTRHRIIPGCPQFSRLAWWLSELGIFLETGRRVSDSQCGLRVYPLHVIELIRCKSRRYGFEAEVITRALWAGCPLIQVPVTCRYLPPAERVSHLRPWRDGVRSFFMHFALTVRRVIPWPPPRLFRSKKPTSGISPGIAAGKLEGQPLWPMNWWTWVNPIHVWHQLRAGRFEQLVVAAALGIGAFMSNVPLGGWQIVLAAYVARRTHVHCIPVVAASLLCLGPIGAGLSAVAIGTGYWMFHFSPADIASIAPEHLTHWQRLARVPAAWPIGAAIVGFLCTWIVLPLCERLFRLIPVRRDSD